MKRMVKRRMVIALFSNSRYSGIDSGTRVLPPGSEVRSTSAIAPDLSSTHASKTKTMASAEMRPLYAASARLKGAMCVCSIRPVTATMMATTSWKSVPGLTKTA